MPRHGAARCAGERGEARLEELGVNGHGGGDWMGLSRLERLDPRIIWGDQAPT